MIRFTGTAALIALAVANPVAAPVHAQGKDDKGGHAKHDQRDRGKNERAENRGNGDDRGERSGNRGDDRAAPRDLRALRQVSEREVRSDRDAPRVARDRGDDFDDARAYRRDDDRDGNWYRRDRAYAAVPGCPPGLAKRYNGCLPPGLARNDRDRSFGYAYRPALFGIPLQTRASYVYHDGYLIPDAGASGLSFIPLLGGALAVGQIWPQAYPSLPIADWQSEYFGIRDEQSYRYADNVVYRVDPETSAIESVVALLTGNDFAVGERIPDGYDVYNVPSQYQDRYADSDEAMYRYADGRVYEIDPTSMLIAKAIDLIV